MRAINEWRHRDAREPSHPAAGSPEGAIFVGCVGASESGAPPRVAVSRRNRPFWLGSRVFREDPRVQRRPEADAPLICRWHVSFGVSRSLRACWVDEVAVPRSPSGRTCADLRHERSVGATGLANAFALCLAIPRERNGDNGIGGRGELRGGSGSRVAGLARGAQSTARQGSGAAFAPRRAPSPAPRPPSPGWCLCRTAARGADGCLSSTPRAQKAKLSRDGSESARECKSEERDDHYR